MSVIMTADIQDTEATPPYFYMHTLESLYQEPEKLLYNYNIPYQRKRFLLKQWRDDRTRYLLEYCRDMDYLNDTKMAQLLYALQEMKKAPRRFQ